MSQWLDFPVKNKVDWQNLKENRLGSHYAQRLSDGRENDKKQIIALSSQKIVMLTSFPLLGSFGAIRQLMGYANMVYAAKDDLSLLGILPMIFAHCG
jgi:hypothetical protein